MHRFNFEVQHEEKGERRFKLQVQHEEKVKPNNAFELTKLAKASLVAQGRR